MVMHFVNSLHLHFMNKVAFSDWNTLYSNLTTAGDMQQVVVCAMILTRVRYWCVNWGVVSGDCVAR
jgi:hypothetical protein